MIIRCFFPCFPTSLVHPRPQTNRRRRRRIDGATRLNPLRLEMASRVCWGRPLASRRVAAGGLAGRALLTAALVAPPPTVPARPAGLPRSPPAAKRPAGSSTPSTARLRRAREAGLPLWECYSQVHVSQPPSRSPRSLVGAVRQCGRGPLADGAAAALTALYSVPKEATGVLHSSDGPPAGIPSSPRRPWLASRTLEKWNALPSQGLGICRTSSCLPYSSNARLHVAY